jgi:hypothetical protein
LELNQR